MGSLRLALFFSVTEAKYKAGEIAVEGGFLSIPLFSEVLCSSQLCQSLLYFSLQLFEDKSFHFFDRPLPLSQSICILALISIMSAPQLLMMAPMFSSFLSTRPHCSTRIGYVSMPSHRRSLSQGLCDADLYLRC